jgi:hypothetical protein
MGFFAAVVYLIPDYEFHEVGMKKKDESSSGKASEVYRIININFNLIYCRNIYLQ